MKSIHPLPSTATEIPDLDSEAVFECDTVASFAEAMKIGRTAVYEDIGRGLIKIVKRGKKTLIPPGERTAYLRRLIDIGRITDAT